MIKTGYIKQELDITMRSIKYHSVFLFYLSYALLLATLVVSVEVYDTILSLFLGMLIPMVAGLVFIKAQIKAKKTNNYDCYGIVALCISAYIFFITLHFL